MSFRLGRLRVVDVALFASGALQLHLLFSPGMFKVCGVPAAPTVFATSLMTSGSFVRWLVLVTGLMALLVVPFGLIRRSPASALWLAVVLTPLGVINLVGVLSLTAFTPDEAGWGGCAERGGAFYVMLVNALVLLLLALLSIRSENRGLDPDDTPAPVQLSLDGTRTDA